MPINGEVAPGDYVGWTEDKDGNFIDYVNEKDVDFAELEEHPNGLKEKVDEVQERLGDDKQLTVSKIFELELDGDHSSILDEGGSVTIRFLTELKDGETLHVLHQLPDGTWEEITGSRLHFNDDGTVDIKFYNLGYVVFAVSTNRVSAADAATSTSPKTGRPLYPFWLLAAAVNTLFNHEGATILAYLPSGNPLTLESIAYGFAAAAMLAAVVLWFSCWNTVMTSDKLMHLFGRVVPALSLLLSMTLRFVPRFQAKLREVTAARRGMGLYAEKGRLQKLKSAVTVFSVMVTWSLENAVETADSMKSRGYGLPGRTAFSLYRYSRRDRLLLLWLALCGAYVAAGWALGGVKWRYYPTARGVLTPYSASVLLAYFLLCLTPVLLQRKEARTWSSIASKA